MPDGSTPPGVIGATIITRGGRYFDFADPQVSSVDIEDIAWALSNLCRFNGHTKAFYSVAEHCVRCSWYEPHIEPFAKLMHDASEAYTGDIPSPLKHFLPEFKTLERRVEVVVAQAFGLPLPWSPSVKRADIVLLHTEKRDLTASEGHTWPGLADYPPLSARIMPWTPMEANLRFLNRFRELEGDR